MPHITVWRLSNGNSSTFTDLSASEAQVIVDLVAASKTFLIADASPETGRIVHPRNRTSWYTRDLPEGI